MYMQEVSNSLKEANKLLRTADHLVYVTYPLIKDNKLIITITENLAEGMKKAMDALLYYDKYYKRIMILPHDFQSKMNIFKESCTRYNINLNYLNLLRDLNELQNAHKKSTMEFVRNDKYVITENNFNIKTLTYQKAKEYVNSSKPFFAKINFLLQNVKN